MSIYSRLTSQDEDDDDKLLSPSQRAREEQKSKSSSIYSRLTEKREVEKEPEKKPSPFERIKEKVVSAFKKPEPPKLPEVKKTEGFIGPRPNINVLDNYIDDLKSREAYPSASLSEFGIHRYSPEGQKEVREVATREVEEARRELPEGYKEPGLLGQAVESIKQSSIGMVGSLGATAELIGNMTKQVILTEAGQKVNKESKKVLASHPEWNQPEDLEWGPTKVTRLVAGAAPSLLGVIAATLVAGPVGGFAVGFGLEGGSTYDECIASGGSEKDCQTSGVIVGTVNGMLERIFPNKLLSSAKKEVKNKISKTLANSILGKVKKSGVRFGKDGLLEGSTEVFQGLVSNSVATTYDENRKLWDGLLESFVGGFGTGGIAGQFGDRVDSRFVEIMPESVGETVEESNLKGTEAGNKIIEKAKEAESKNANIEIDLSGIEGEIVTTPSGNKIGVMVGAERTVVEKEPVDKTIEKPAKPIDVKPEQKLTKADVVEKPKVVEGGLYDPLVKEASKYESADDFFLHSKEGRDALRKQDIKSQEAIKSWWNKNITPKAPIIDSVNPTGSVLVDYDPKSRMTMELGENITTLDKTSGKSADELITIYRGAPKNQKKIAPGDFITTNRDLAKSYTGEGNILQEKVKVGDILDDITEPLGEEYIYKPRVPQQPLAKGGLYDVGKGEVVLYHRTTPENAKKISETGKFISKENTNEIFLSNKKAGQNVGYGEEIVPVKVKKSDIRLDDEFPSGEKHYAVKVEKANVAQQPSVEAKKPSKPSKKVKAKAKPKVVKVPSRQLPVGEGKERASTLESRLKGVMGEATQEQIEELGLATARSVNLDKNIASAKEYVENNTEDALRVVKGEIDPPKGILQNSVFIALTELGRVDSDVATKVAGLASFRFGQEIVVLKKILSDNPVVMMQDIVKTSIEAYEKRTGKKATERVKQETAKITKKAKPTTEKQWDSFIESIRC